MYNSFSVVLLINLAKGESHLWKQVLQDQSINIYSIMSLPIRGNLYEHVYDYLINQGISPEDVQRTLIAEGYPEETTKDLIAQVIKDYRKQLFDEVNKKKKQEEIKNVGITVVGIIAAACYFAGLNSPAGIWLSAIIAGAIGYYCFAEKPIAGLAGSMVYIIAAAYTFDFYFSGRHTFITIEMLIPLFLAGIAGFLAFYIIQFIFYKSEK